MSEKRTIDMTREEEIRARCEAATKGPWEYDGMHHEIQCFHGDKFWLVLSELREHPGDEPPMDEFGHIFNADFEFIAHARADIPYLLDRLEFMTEAYDRNAEVHKTLTRDYVTMKGENERLRAELEAALSDLERAEPCDCCKRQYTDDCLLEETMAACSEFVEGGKWEWRGVAENGGSTATGEADT